MLKIKRDNSGKLRWIWKDENKMISDNFSFFKFIKNFPHAIKPHNSRKDYTPFKFYKGWTYPSFKYSKAGYFSPYPRINFSVLFGKVYLEIPYNTGINECEPPCYGFYFYKEGGGFFNSLWLNLGDKVKCIHMPWEMDWYRTSTLLNNDKWFHETKGSRIRHFSSREDSKMYGGWEWLQENRFKETFDYTYKLNNGEIQYRKATVSVKEYEHRPRWFKWTKLFTKVSRSISIEFDKEVGEQTGSWKGGCTGCFYNLLPNETPEQCLRRMEKERKF